MIRIAICDDEPLFVDKISALAERYKNEVNSSIVISKYTDGKNLVENIKNIDLLFLDVEMPNVDGFQVAKEIRKLELDCSICFLTSICEMGYRGYEFDAVDYIIKPVNYNRFCNVISSEIEKIKKKRSSIVIFQVKSKKLKQINITDLVYVEAKGRKCIVNCIDFEFLVGEKLKAIQKKLIKYDIFKPHRSYIINLWKVKDYDRRNITMDNESIIPISRRRYKKFREHYYNFLKNMEEG